MQGRGYKVGGMLKMIDCFHLNVFCCQLDRFFLRYLAPRVAYDLLLLRRGWGLLL